MPDRLTVFLKGAAHNDNIKHKHVRGVDSRFYMRTRHTRPGRHTPKKLCMRRGGSFTWLCTCGWWLKHTMSTSCFVYDAASLLNERTASISHAPTPPPPLTPTPHPLNQWPVLRGCNCLFTVSTKSLSALATPSQHSSSVRLLATNTREQPLLLIYLFHLFAWCVSSGKVFLDRIEFQIAMFSLKTLCIIPLMWL